MENSKEKIIYINFNATIGQEETRAFMEFCMSVIHEHNPDAFYFLFASPGGDVDSGIVLYNFLKSLPQKIVMHNIGSVDSIGIVVFLAGDERYASPHTSFLFHPIDHTPEESKLDLKKLEEIESKIKKDEDKICSIVCSDTDISEDEMRQFFEQGEEKSEGFAKDRKLLHAIQPIQINKKDIFLNFYFKKEKH